jgi:hypothetical protein
MKEVICQFCQQLAAYTPLEEMEIHSVRVYWCEPCHAEYLHFSESPVVNSCSLYTTINNRMYRWSVTVLDHASLWYIEEPGIPGVKANKGTVRLFSLGRGEAKPTVTPQNIHDKLATYLLFL